MAESALISVDPSWPDMRTRGIRGSRLWTPDHIDFNLVSANPLEATAWTAEIIGAPWASLNLTSGSLASLATQALTLTFDGSALAGLPMPGGQGRLVFTVSSTLEPSATVEVAILAAAMPSKLSVTGRPRYISLETGSPVPASWTETVTNLTEDSLDVTATASEAWLTPISPDTFTLAGGASQAVSVTVDTGYEIGDRFAVLYEYEDTP